MFIGSVGGLDRSSDSRSRAIPDGALVTCWLSLEESLVSLLSQSLRHSASTKFQNAYRARSFRFRLMAIILHVRFSIRSWLGNCSLVLLYSFHIWVTNGSFFCISSGGPKSALDASSRQPGKKASRRSSLRVWLRSGEISSLPLDGGKPLPDDGVDGGGRVDCDDDGGRGW